MLPEKPRAHYTKGSAVTVSSSRSTPDGSRNAREGAGDLIVVTEGPRTFAYFHVEDIDVVV